MAVDVAETVTVDVKVLVDLVALLHVEDAMLAVVV